MAWSNKPIPLREVTLGPHGSDTLDVVYAVNGNRELHLATLVQPYYPAMMSLAGQYRFTFQLISDNAASRTVTLKVHWTFDIHTLRFPTNLNFPLLRI